MKILPLVKAIGVALRGPVLIAAASLLALFIVLVLVAGYFLFKKDHGTTGVTPTSPGTGMSQAPVSRPLTELKEVPRDGAGDPNRIYTGNDVTQKARLLSKPEPMYTEQARKKKVSGIVVLHAVLTWDGRVTNIRVESGLPYALTDQAIVAARKIEFVPATKDGHPVSQYIQLEYYFHP